MNLKEGRRTKLKSLLMAALIGGLSIEGVLCAPVLSLAISYMVGGQICHTKPTKSNGIWSCQTTSGKTAISKTCVAKAEGATSVWGNYCEDKVSPPPIPIKKPPSEAPPHEHGANMR